MASTASFNESSSISRILLNEVNVASWGLIVVGMVDLITFLHSQLMTKLSQDEKKPFIFTSKRLLFFMFWIPLGVYQAFSLFHDEVSTEVSSIQLIGLKGIINFAIFLGLGFVLRFANKIKNLEVKRRTERIVRFVGVVGMVRCISFMLRLTWLAYQSRREQEDY